MKKRANRSLNTFLDGAGVHDNTRGDVNQLVDLKYLAALKRMPAPETSMATRFSSITDCYIYRQLSPDYGIMTWAYIFGRVYR